MFHVKHWKFFIVFGKEIEEHILATTLQYFVEISRYEMQMCDENKS